MSVLSPEEIYQLAIKHGFNPGQQAAMATAIAQAESSGKTNNFNSKDPNGGSIGLMQINGANAHLIGGDNWKTVGADPDASMAAAYQLFSRRGGFGDWGTYTNGSYKQYLNQASAAARNAALPPGTTTLNSTPAPSPPMRPYTPTPQTAGPAYAGVAPAATTPVPDDQNFFQRLMARPAPTKDAQGNEVQGKSPLEKIAGGLGGKQQAGNQQAAAPQPAQFAPPQDPTAQLAGPAAQLYSTVQAAAAKPLSWSSRPYGWDAGPQMAPGATLNTTGYGYG